MNRCETCKHWERFTETPLSSFNFDHEMIVGEGEEVFVDGRHASVRDPDAYEVFNARLAALWGDGAWGDCNGVPFKQGIDIPPEKVLAYVVDASMYTAALVTHKEFGCAMWESK